jgi:hypothetical protein
MFVGSHHSNFQWGHPTNVRGMLALAEQTEAATSRGSYVLFSPASSPATQSLFQVIANVYVCSYSMLVYLPAH